MRGENPRPRPHYTWRTRRGTFAIAPDGEGRWNLFFGSDCLDNYETPDQAAEDAAGGHCAWPSFGDPSALGISADVSDWAFVAS